MQAKPVLISTAIAGAAASIGLAIFYGAPTSSLLVIAIFGAIVFGLFGLQAVYFVPFDFKQLRGNAPRPALPTVYDNTIAREDGSKLSRTPLARVFAVLMGVALVVLFVITISAIKAPQTAAVSSVVKTASN